MNARSHLMRYDAKVNMMKVLNIFRPFEFCVSCRYFSQHLDSSPKMYFFDYVYTRILVRFRSFSHFIHLTGRRPTWLHFHIRFIPISVRIPALHWIYLFYLQIHMC